MSFKNSELLTLYDVLENLSKDDKIKKSFKYKLTASKIKERIREYVVPLKENYPKLREKYKIEYQAIFLKNAKKDENGKVVLKNDVKISTDGDVKLSDIEIDNKDQFDLDLEELNKRITTEDINSEIIEYKETLSEVVKNLRLPKFKESMFEDSSWDSVDDSVVDFLYKLKLITK